MRDFEQLEDLDIIFPNVRKVLCTETAASLLNMSTTWGRPFEFFHNSKNIALKSRSGYFAPIYRDELPEEDIITINGREVTNKSRTICDMLALGSDPQTLCESMAYFYVDSGYSWDTLLTDVKRHSVSAQFERWRDLAESVLNDG